MGKRTANLSTRPHHQPYQPQAWRLNARAAAARTLICLGLAAGLGSAVLPQHAYAQAAAQQFGFDIPAGSLDATLTSLAATAGIDLSVDAALTQGRQSPGVRGNLSVDAAFSEALRGQPLAVVRGGNGTWSLRRVEARDDRSQALPQVSVVAVQERAATTEGSGSYYSPVVTLGRGEQAIKDIPQSVSVLTRQRLDDQNIVSIRDAVNNVTGVIGVQGVGPGLAITTRGFFIDSWQYDGIAMPRNNYTLGNWAQEGLVFYDRMEVLRGVSTLLQGAGSPGGAINLVRKRPQAETTVTVTAKAGSWDRYGLQLDAGGPLNKEGTLRGRVVVDDDERHSFINSVWSKTRSLYAALDADIGRDTTIGVGVSNMESTSRPMFVGFPRYTNSASIGLPRSTFTGSDWNRAEVRQTNIYADLKHRINPNWSFNAGVIHMEEKNDSVHQRAAFAVASDGSGLRYGDFGVKFDSEKLGLDVNLQGKFDAFSLRNDMVVGASYSSYTSTDAFTSAWSTGGNIFAIDNHRAAQTFESIAARGSTTRAKYAVYQRGLYGNLRTHLTDKLTSSIGGRFSWYNYRYIGSSVTQKQDSGKFTPYAGLVYALTPQWSAYVSGAKIFEPQSERDASNKVLDSITGTNYEVGLKGDLMDGKGSATLALFRYDHNNRAVNDLAAGFACDGWYCSRASGKVRSQGLEAEINGEVLRGLQLFAGYAYVTTKYLNDPANEGKIYSTWTPRHSLRLWADYKVSGMSDKLSVGGGVTMQTTTKAYDYLYNNPGYAIWNARMSYQVTPEVQLALNVNNVFNKTYLASSYDNTTGNNYYGDPRNVMFTVKYTPKF